MNLEKPRALMFIPPWLRQSVLTPVQFRLACHVQSIGNCWRSLSTMARECRVSRKTAQTALKQLVSMGVLERERRCGQTCIYRFSPSAQDALAKLEPNPKETLGYRPSTEPNLHPTSQPKIDPTPLTQKRPYKVYPNEVLNSKRECCPPVKKPPKEMWQLRKDKRECVEAIHQEEGRANPDPAILAGLRTELAQINDGMREYGSRVRNGETPQKPQPKQAAVGRTPKQPEQISEAERLGTPEMAREFGIKARLAVNGE